MWIVVTVFPGSGPAYHGPFPSEEAAAAYRRKNFNNSQFSGVAPLTKMG